MTAERVVVDGVALEARWIGPRPEEAPTIVLLHEGLGCVRRWSTFPEALADATGCGVFVYSRAGYGGSDPVALPRPVTYMHDEALNTLPRLLDAMGFRRGILLGQSDGASIATIYAGGVLDHRIRGLALIAPHFFVEEVSVASVAKMVAAYERGDLRERLAKYHGSNVDNAFRGWSGAWLDPEFRSWDIREHIAYVRVPILIIQGTNDEYGTSAQVAAAEEEAYCPVEVAMLEGAGHSPHLERPADVTGLVTEFVRRVEMHESSNSISIRESDGGVTHGA